MSQRWKSSSMCKPVTRICNKVKNTLYTSNQWLKTYPTFVELWFSSCNRFYSCPFYWHPVGNHLCMCNLKHSKTRMVQIKLPQLLHLPCLNVLFTSQQCFSSWIIFVADCIYTWNIQACTNILYTNYFVLTICLLFCSCQLSNPALSTASFFCSCQLSIHHCISTPEMF